MSDVAWLSTVGATAAATDATSAWLETYDRTHVEARKRRAYAKAIKAAPGGVVEHVRGAFGDHGFGLKRFWADKAATWLREVVGVGAEVQAEAS